MFDELDDVLIKSWLGIKDYNTHFYKSTPNSGSPYDLSVHHSGIELYFEAEEFQSYLGAGLIKDISADSPFDLIQFKNMKCELIRGFEVFEGENGTLVYKILDGKEHPLYSHNVRHDEYFGLERTPKRAVEPIRRYNHKIMNDVKLQFKEKESLELIINSLLKSEKPVVSSSFGKDSLVALHLTLRAMELLNLNPKHLIVYYSDTLNEFPSVRQLSKRLEKEWDLNLVVSKPDKPLKKIIDEHGGIDESYFRRKGDRTQGMTLSEKCCNGLKHAPYKAIRKSNGYDLTIAGVRSPESRQRHQAAIRDGEYYYASSWNSYRLNPILHWTDEEVFQYIEKYHIPLPDVYHQNLILSDDLTLDQWEDLSKLGVKDGVIEDPLLALEIEKMGYKVFTPRVGCMMCPIPINYGYLTWLRRFYPKVFQAMIFKMGYAPFVWPLVDDDKKEEIKQILGEVTTLKLLENPDLLQQVVEYMPCVFDVN